MREQSTGGVRAPRIKWGFSPGDTVGRYRITERLGQGGMSVVYLAHDPVLDRDVALKVLRGWLARSDHAQRLQREAEAVASLSHPNVVEIFDVGHADGQLYIAMEYIRGRTLAELIKRDEPGWRDVLPLLIRAGRGLAAAHERGIVHRDFKPSNVMVGDDGRVRVLDFGLARWVDAPQERGTPDGVTPGPSGPELTADGTIVGTLVFMAPEQHEGRAVDHRADQYAFCVSLFWALHGRYPFETGEDDQALYLEKLCVESTLESAEGRTPRALHACLVQGLAPRARNRFASMDALLERLEAIAAPRRRRRALTFVAAAGALAAVSSAAWVGRAQERSCGEAPALWTPEDSAAISSALLGGGDPYGETVVATVVARLDEQAQTWTRAWKASCSAASPVDTACLEHSRRSFRAAVDVLSSPDTPARDAVAVVEALARPPRPGECRDAGGEAERALLDAIARARALERAARYDDALEVAHDALEIGTSAPADLRSRLKLHVGVAHLNLGRQNEAIAAFEDAHALATTAGNDFLVARMAIYLMYMAGALAEEFETARQWRRRAEAAIARAGGDALLQGELDDMLSLIEIRAGDIRAAKASAQRGCASRRDLPRPDLIKARCLMNQAQAEFMLEEYDAALEHAWAAHDIRRELLGEEHPLVAVLGLVIGQTLARMDRYEEAERVLRETRDQLRATSPRLHPNNAAILNGLGMVLSEQGKARESILVFEEALELTAQMYGPNHPSVALAHQNLGASKVDLGELDEAKTHLVLARDALEAAYGENHPMTRTVLTNLARAHSLDGEHDHAVAAARQAVARAEVVDGPDDPSLSLPLGTLTDCYIRARRLDEALAAAQRVYALDRDTYGDNGSDAVYSLSQVGEVFLAQGHHERAAEVLRKALRVQARIDPDPSVVGHTEYLLGLALVDTDPDASRVHLAAARERLEASAHLIDSRRDLAAIDAFERR